ncbi:tetratricopeptide repeat protein [Bremerella alba]|nr:tetratricopeptide repeat protein [Bremerella alba]
MVSKEVAVALPILLLWYDRTFISPSWKELVRSHFPLYVAALCTWLVFLPFANQSEQKLKADNVAYVVETSIVDGHVQERAITAWDYLLRQPQAILLYLRLVFFPYGQSLDHGWRATTTLVEAVLPGLLIFLLLGATIWSTVHYPRFGFLGGWFFLILAPTSSILPIKDVAVEHRMYLPSAAVLAFLILVVFEGLCRRYGSSKHSISQVRRGVLISGVAVALIFSGVTLVRNEVYRSKLGLWTDVTSKAPEYARGYYGLARAHIDLKQFEPAIASLQRAIELDPRYTDAYVSLGRIVHASQPEYATQLFTAAVKVDPNSSEAHSNLGAMLTEKMPKLALVHYQQAIHLNEENADAHNNIANLFARRGQFSEAVRHYEAALSIRPDFDQAAMNLETVRHLAIARDQEQVNPN